MPEIYLFGGSFDPPGLHHVAILQNVLTMLQPDDRCFVIPCGMRPDKNLMHTPRDTHRFEMCLKAFGSFPRVKLDFHDLGRDIFRRTMEIDVWYKILFPRHKIWHVIGTDLIVGGANGISEIQTKWFRGIEIWNQLPFVVQPREGTVWSMEDLPERTVVLSPCLSGSSTEIRTRISRGESIDHLVSPDVLAYIEEHGLYHNDADLPQPLLSKEG